MKHKKLYNYFPITFLIFATFTFTNGVNALSYKTSLVSPLHEGNSQSHIQELNTNGHLYEICKNDIEGFQEMLSGSEFFSYPSIRDDVGTSMIARATTGKMGFEFLTGVVPTDYTADQVTFFMLSDIDLNLHESFDIYVNDKPILTFNSNEDGSLSITQNPGNGNAEYILVRRDDVSCGLRQGV